MAELIVAADDAGYDGVAAFVVDVVPEDAVIGQDVVVVGQGDA